MDALLLRRHVDDAHDVGRGFVQLAESELQHVRRRHEEFVAAEAVEVLCAHTTDRKGQQWG